jgi:hypothetical protein
MILKFSWFLISTVLRSTTLAGWTFISELVFCPAPPANSSITSHYQHSTSLQRLKNRIQTAFIIVFAVVLLSKYTKDVDNQVDKSLIHNNISTNHCTDQLRFEHCFEMLQLPAWLNPILIDKLNSLPGADTLYVPRPSNRNQNNDNSKNNHNQNHNQNHNNHNQNHNNNSVDHHEIKQGGSIVQQLFEQFNSLLNRPPSTL